MELIYIWIAAGIVFLIIEMMIVTLYWLSMSIAAFVVAIYVYFIKAQEADINQFIIFVVLSTILVFTFPKFFHLSKWTGKIWTEAYVNKICKLKKVWQDWKVEVEWVDYLINDSSVDNNFEIWKKVKIISSAWTSLNVTLI